AGAPRAPCSRTATARAGPGWAGTGGGRGWALGAELHRIEARTQDLRVLHRPLQAVRHDEGERVAGHPEEVEASGAARVDPELVDGLVIPDPVWLAVLGRPPPHSFGTLLVDTVSGVNGVRDEKGSRIA